jgi:hypothetical protein
VKLPGPDIAGGGATVSGGDGKQRWPAPGGEEPLAAARQRRSLDADFGGC